MVLGIPVLSGLQMAVCHICKIKPSTADLQAEIKCVYISVSGHGLALMQKQVPVSDKEKINLPSCKEEMEYIPLH